MASRRSKRPRPPTQQRRPAPKKAAKRPSKPKAPPPGIFGHYPQEDAIRLFELVQDAGIDATLDLDRDLARMHKAATAINPALRRRSTFHDVKTGWYIRVAPEEVERVTGLLKGTEFDQALAFAPQGDAGEEPEFFSDPRWCPACKAEAPPRTDLCPTCSGETVDILHKGRDAEPRGFWSLLAIGVIVAALALARLLR